MSSNDEDTPPEEYYPGLREERIKKENEERKLKRKRMFDTPEEELEEMTKAVWHLLDLYEQRHIFVVAQKIPDALNALFNCLHLEDRAKRQEQMGG